MRKGVAVLFVVLAALAGVVWGVADFSGGKATQEADALAVVWVSKLVSVPLLVGCLVLTTPALDPRGMLWGVLAGGCGTLGTTLFYRALSSGAMTTVAPVTAVTSATAPVVVGLWSGERPPALALAGVSCALVALLLVSLGTSVAGVSTKQPPQLVGLAVAAGLCFGLFMVCLARAARSSGAENGLWTLLGSHTCGLLLGAGLLATGSRPGHVRGRASIGWPRGRALGWACAAGLLDTTGSATFVVGAGRGDLSLLAPLAALYPVSTVLLALVVDKERPRPPQVVGLLLAVAALQLVARPET